MELGATICLPRAPLCLQCPVYAMCLTRGEHPTPPRAPQLSRPAAYLLITRKSGTATEVLLERRDPTRPSCPPCLSCRRCRWKPSKGREPILRLRHSITNTNYYVQIYTGVSPWLRRRPPHRRRRSSAKPSRPASPTSTGSPPPACPCFPSPA